MSDNQVIPEVAVNNKRMTISEFLEARITEDETECKPVAATEDDDRGGWAITYALRVIAECAAKRDIIADHTEFVEAIDGLSAAVPGDLNQGQGAPWRTATLRHLAAVYADHPDYRQEWAK